MNPITDALNLVTTVAAPAPAPVTSPTAPPAAGGGTVGLIAALSVAVLSEVIGMSKSPHNSILQLVLRVLRAVAQEFAAPSNQTAAAAVKGVKREFH